MRNGYRTKRTSPQGYVAVTKPLAKALYEQGHHVTLCGNRVRGESPHIFDGWCLGCTIQNGHRSFEEQVVSYLCHLDPALGQYVVFYVRENFVLA